MNGKGKKWMNNQRLLPFLLCFPFFDSGHVAILYLMTGSPLAQAFFEFPVEPWLTLNSAGMPGLQVYTTVSTFRLYSACLFRLFLSSGLGACLLRSLRRAQVFSPPSPMLILFALMRGCLLRVGPAQTSPLSSAPSAGFQPLPLGSAPPPCFYST